jgi:hypothetical protein
VPSGGFVQARGGVLVTAADDWLSLKVASPMPGRCYLVAAEIVGTVMDVAWFEGPRPQGGLWWVMGGIEFPHAAIRYFAPLNPPKAKDPP